jgi:hypothetical protein
MGWPAASSMTSCRALLHVSQGGPRRNPRILPALAAASSQDQSLGECTFIASSMAVSSEITVTEVVHA